MTSATPSSLALVAEAFDDRIAREALVLAMFIRDSANAPDHRPPSISDDHVIAGCSWQIATYLELLTEASKATETSMEEIVQEAIKCCKTKHELRIQKLRNTPYKPAQ